MTPTTSLLRVVALGLAGAAAAIATASASAAPTAVDRCKPPAKFGAPKGERATIYRDYCEICRDTGWREIKRTYQLKGPTPAKIAFQYASQDHFGSVLPPANQGCARGFALRGRP